MKVKISTVKTVLHPVVPWRDRYSHEMARGEQVGPWRAGYLLPLGCQNSDSEESVNNKKRRPGQRAAVNMKPPGKLHGRPTRRLKPRRAVGNKGYDDGRADVGVTVPVERKPVPKVTAALPPLYWFTVTVRRAPVRGTVPVVTVAAPSEVVVISTCVEYWHDGIEGHGRGVGG